MEEQGLGEVRRALAREWARRGVLLMMSLAVSLVGLECALRWLEPPNLATSQDFRAPHPTLGWKPEPGARFTYHPDRGIGVSVAYNAAGFRDVARAPEKASDVRRVLVLGDSFMEAYSVEPEDAFTRRLERALAGRGAPRVEVWNLGVGGYGTLQELRVFESDGVPAHPDLVLLGFFAGNDLADNSLALSQALRATHGLKRTARPFLDARALPAWRVLPGDFAAAQRQYVAQRGAGAWRRFAVPTAYRRLRRSLASQLFAWRDPGGWRREARVQAVAELGENLCLEPSEIREAWRITAALLTRLRDASARAGAGLVVFSVPSGMEVVPANTASARRTLAELGLGDTCADAATPPAMRRLASELAALRVPFIDLVPAFRASAATDAGALFHPLDGHWNARGHALAARTVAPYVRAALAPGR